MPGIKVVQYGIGTWNIFRTGRFRRPWKQIGVVMRVATAHKPVIYIAYDIHGSLLGQGYNLRQAKQIIDERIK